MHDDPQVVANGLIADVDYPDGTLSLVAPPVMFDEVAARPERAPEFGEHTDDVLAAAGYDALTIERYRAAGVVG
jgi:crotonobetainyl-CoA:carnitine CoA-transferase CaiB-like acyl-CoA transferase